MHKICKLFIINILAVLCCVSAKAQTCSFEPRKECLAPAVAVKAPYLREIFDAVIKKDNIPGLPEFAWLLKNPEVDFAAKIRYLQAISGALLNNKRAVDILKDTARANPDNFLGECAGLLAMRNNPAVWIDKKYIRMDEERFLRMLAGQGIKIGAQARNFARLLPELTAEKNKFLKQDPEAWSYPYSCTYLCSIMLDKIQRAGFRAYIEIRQFPEDSAFFGGHAYVVVVLDGREYIVDFTAAQFEKLDFHTFQEPGIVIVPRETARWKKADFYIYNCGRQVQIAHPYSRRPAFEGVMLEVMQRIMRGRQKKKFVFIKAEAGPKEGLAEDSPRDAELSAILDALTRLVKKNNAIPLSINQYSADFLNRQGILLDIYKRVMDYLAEVKVFEKGVIIYPFIGADTMPAAYRPTIGININPEVEYPGSQLIATAARDLGLDAAMMRANMHYARDRDGRISVDGRNLAEVEWPLDLKGQDKIFFVKGLMHWANFSVSQREEYLSGMDENLLSRGDKVVFLDDRDGEEAVEFLRRRGNFRALNGNYLAALNTILGKLKNPGTFFGDQGLLIPTRLIVLEKEKDLGQQAPMERPVNFSRNLSGQTYTADAAI